MSLTSIFYGEGNSVHMVRRRLVVERPHDLEDPATGNCEARLAEAAVSERHVCSVDDVPVSVHDIRTIEVHV